MSELPFDLDRRIARAVRRLRGKVRVTPLEASPAIGGPAVELHLKLECWQHTGSFKFRGALNRILATKPADRGRGFVTASSGNHGLAVARALALLGLEGTICLPRSASPAKVRALKRLGARLRRHGADCLETELFARAFAARTGSTYVSPYNDPDVVAGQGTIGVEIAAALPDVDTVIAAVGGGGLVAGVAAALRVHRPGIEVIGALPRRSPVMAKSVAAGRILDLPGQETLSDGTAGGLEAGAVTFPLCQTLVDRFVLVSEAAIARAMRLAMEAHHLVIEGAAGVALAAFEAERARLRGRRVAVILCGRNVATATVRDVLNGGRRTKAVLEKREATE